MKRSEINQIIKDAKDFLDVYKFKLPKWAYWSPGKWQEEKGNVEDIVKNAMGWDITDFGSGDFNKKGLFLFTLRNGNLQDKNKPYAEKIMIVEEEQETPMHFHWNKQEDIINRGGGNLVIEVYRATNDEKLSEEPLTVKIDGYPQQVKAGGKVVITPGESICLEPYVYHRFYGEKGKGKVLVGEVSMVNDDNTDNCFHEPVGRFPEITEDEDPLHLLIPDYDKYL
jgi:D-lyxose ketol-isomerase